jgi:hypothetical protein
LPIVLEHDRADPRAVDTGVVGQMGEAAPIGAVGLGAIILTAIYWIFGFLRMGTVGLRARPSAPGPARGGRAPDPRADDRRWPAARPDHCSAGADLRGAFRLAPATAEVEALARDYMAIRIWSAPALIALYGITGWLIAAERTRAVLAIQLWMNGLNIVLDLWFVLGLGWGVNGRRGRHLPCRMVGLRRRALVLPRRDPAGHWRDWPRVFDAARLRRMASVNTDILIRSLLLQGMFISFLFTGRASATCRWRPTRSCCSSSTSPPMRWTASPSAPRRWWARPWAPARRGRAAARGLAGEPLGGTGAALRWSSARRPVDHRRDDHGAARGPGLGARLPSLDGARASRGLRAPGCSTASSSARPARATCAT